MGNNNSYNTKISRLIIYIALCLTAFSTQVFADTPLAYNYDPLTQIEQSLDHNSIFQTNLFTGAFVYTYELEVPPGTNGLQPSVNLQYNSHAAYDRPEVLGSGWRLNEEYIERYVNGTRNNLTDDFFVLRFSGNSQKLIQRSSDTTYRTEIDSFIKIENQTGGNNEQDTYWNVKTQDGTTYRFGFNNDSEIVGNKNYTVWRWYLDQVEDTHGNTVSYTYRQSPYPDDIGAIYLFNITYNNDQQREIHFVYENSNRPDLWNPVENVNQISLSRRLQEIRIKADQNLVRKYTLTYEDEVSGLRSHSFLTQITEYGSDGTSTLPPTVFGYYGAPDSIYGVTSSYDIPDCQDSSKNGCFVTTSAEDAGVRLIDANRDGYLDVIRGKGTSKKSSINNANGWTTNTNWDLPSGFTVVDNDHDDEGVQFADVNGDGLIDLLKAKDSVTDTKINTGDGWIDDPTWDIPDCNGASTSGCFTVSDKDNGVRLGDVNGDGLVDLISSKKIGSSTTRNTWINTGHGWKTDSTLLAPDCISNSRDGGCFTIDSQDNGVRLADVNGDGLIDIVKAKRAGNSVTKNTWINNGHGWTTDSRWLVPDCTSSSNSGCFLDDGGTGRVRFADVNGDRLPDLLGAQGIESKPLGSANTWLNDGIGWTSHSFFKIPKCEQTNIEYCFMLDTTPDQGVRLGDINGDGMVDILVNRARSGNAFSEMRINQAIKMGLLSNITSSLGGTTRINYTSSTNNDLRADGAVANMSFTLWVVESVQQDNGIDTVHNLTTHRSFNYTHALYDYGEKEFRGFHHVLENISGIKRTSHWFHQDTGRQGREYKTEVNDTAQTIYQQQSFTWNTTLKDDLHYTTLLLQQNTSTYDGAEANPRKTRTTFAYDQFGNIIMQYLEGDLATTGDERYTYQNFVPNETAWIVNAPIDESLYSADNLTKLRETLFSYDGLAYGAVPIQGDLTQQEEFLDTGSNPITLFNYDNYGNLVNTTDANGNVNQEIFGLRDTTFTYPDQSVNAKGHTTNTWYDLGTGNVLATVDPNGFTTNFTYDNFGRVSKEIQPIDTLDYPTKNYTYFFDGTAPEITRIQQREQNATTNTYDTYTIIDGLGNTIQTKVDATNNQQIVQDTYYDKLTRTQKTSNNYFTPATTDYTIPNASVPVTTNTYDTIDRVIKITNPDQTTKHFTFDHWNETQHDENNNTKLIVKDAHGQIIQVHEFNEGDEYITIYTYNDAGDIVEIADAEENTFTFFFDTLGRRISLVDPDLGTWNYTYDGVGNLLTTTDARETTTTNTYDELDRALTKSTPTQTYTYIYDQDTIGTLTNISTVNFSKNFTYDQRLRITHEVKTINDKSYTLEYEYDSMDRQTRRNLFGQSMINYTYSDQNTIQSVAPVTNDATHNEISAITARAYANSEVTNYTYDQENFRLMQIKTGDKQNLQYTYDDIADVTSINDSAHNRLYTMTYDALSRLLTATRIDDATTIFDFTYVYNSIGNLLNITSSTENFTYLYNGTPLHAPYQIVYTTPEEALTINNFEDLSGSGSERVFEITPKNTGSMNLTNVTWAIQTGLENITSEHPFNLTTNETLQLFVDYNYTASGNYTVITMITSSLGADTKTLEISVP